MALDALETLDLAERFIRAVESGDLDAVKAAYAPDAVIWHNFDGVEQGPEDNLRILSWFARALPGRRYRIVRREALADGFFQQHIVEATLPDGTAWSMPACLVVKVSDGKITRLDEYLDSAHAQALRGLGRDV
jgi:ketosteroid isomerase-like protein